MFRRAVKLKFNEQKFLQISTVRHQRMPNKDVHSAGKRFAAAFGLGSTFMLVKWRRKDHSHKACYTPLRKGLGDLMSYPLYQAMHEGRVYGYKMGSVGKPYI